MNLATEFPAAIDLLTAEHEAHSRVLEIMDDMRRAHAAGDQARHAQLGRQLQEWTERRDSLHQLYRRTYAVTAAR